MSTTAPRPADGSTRRPLGRRTKVTLATLVTLTALAGGTVAAHAAVTPTSSPTGATSTTTPPAPPADGATPPAPGEAPAAPADRLTHGDVTAVSGDSLTISGPQGEETFTLDADTSVVREQGPGTGPAQAAASDLAVGEHVHVAVVDEAADPLVAATVAIVPAPPAPGTAPVPPADGATPPAPPADGLAHGDVTAVSGDSLTISGPQGEETFTLDPDTSVVREQGPGTGPAQAAASDLAVGEHVHVAVVDEAADPLVAATVAIVPAPPAPGTAPAPPTDGTAPDAGPTPPAPAGTGS